MILQYLANVIIYKTKNSFPSGHYQKTWSYKALNSICDVLFYFLG